MACIAVCHIREHVEQYHGMECIPVAVIYPVDHLHQSRSVEKTIHEEGIAEINRVVEALPRLRRQRFRWHCEIRRHITVFVGLGIVCDEAAFLVMVDTLLTVDHRAKVGVVDVGLAASS